MEKMTFTKPLKPSTAARQVAGSRQPLRVHAVADVEQRAKPQARAKARSTPIRCPLTNRLFGLQHRRV